MKVNIWILVVLCACVLTSCFKDLPPDQLAIEAENIDKALANNTADYIAYHPSAIRFAIHTFGELTMPRSGQNVSFTYAGHFLGDTTLVDTGSYNGAFNSIPLAGLKIAIGGLPVGSSAAIYTPSAYAYGPNGKGKIPGNTTMVYEVKSLSVTMSTNEQIQFNKDTAALHKYLIDKNITNAILHPTGLWYVIHTEGTGERPKVYDRITCSYRGYLLSNGNVFDHGILTDQGLTGLIDGFKVGIPLLKQGTKATLYIPASLAYRASTLNGIPANSNLAFEIDLQSFRK